MTIEEKLFSHYDFNDEKLLEYGFKPENGKYTFKKTLSEDFTIVLECDGKSLNGRIIDRDLNEEYTNFRLKNATGFSLEIRDKFTELLLAVREKCCNKEAFSSEQAKRIGKFIPEKFQSRPEFLWPKYPSLAIYRYDGNNKWFALIGDIAVNKIDPSFEPNEEVSFLNVKVDKKEVEDLLNREGYYPAYHMNQKNWITMILNDTLTDDEIKKRIEDSFERIKKSR